MTPIKNIPYLMGFFALLLFLPGCYTVITRAQTYTGNEEVTANVDTTTDLEVNDSCLSSQDQDSIEIYNGYNLDGEYIPSSLWIDYYIAPLPWWYTGGSSVSGSGGSANSTQEKRNYGQRRSALKGTGEEQNTGSSTVNTGAAVNTTNSGSTTTTTSTTTTSTVNNNNTGSTQTNDTQSESTTRHTETTNERRDYGERSSARGGKK